MNNLVFFLIRTHWNEASVSGDEGERPKINFHQPVNRL